MRHETLKFSSDLRPESRWLPFRHQKENIRRLSYTLT